MFHFRCQCLGFAFGIMLSLSVTAATLWLPANGEGLPVAPPVAASPVAEPGELAQPRDGGRRQASPTPLPVILFAAGLLGAVVVYRIAHRP